MLVNLQEDMKQDGQGLICLSFPKAIILCQVEHKIFSGMQNVEPGIPAISVSKQGNILHTPMGEGLRVHTVLD